MRPEEPLDDPVLARSLAATRTDSFGPYFADRVMRRIAAGPRRGLRISLATGSWALGPRLATSLAVVVVVAGLSWWMSRPATFEAPIGSALALDLPDGSQVTLAPGSTLRQAPFRFARERRVALVGEAYFDVAHGDAAFVVSTGDASVTVTGTRFNVRAWRDGDGTEVALVEGSVLLDPGEAARSDHMTAVSTSGTIALAAGDIARVSPDGRAHLVDPGHSAQQAAAWRDGAFAVSDRPLEAFLADLERRYGTRLEADSSVTRGRTVTYMNPGSPRVEEVLDAVSFALGLRYTRTANGWTLVAADTTRIP